MDPIELLERVKEAPLDPLLAGLREIHRRRSVEPGWLPAEDLFRSLAGGLARERRRPSRPAPPERRTASPHAQDRGSYDSARELFRAHERELQRRAFLTERVLDQVRRGAGVDRILTPAPLQQELRLACPAGGASGGRFVVINETSLEQEVRFDVGAPRRGAPAWAGRLAPLFDPERLRIEPGESRIVRVSVDSASLHARPGEHVELPVDLRGQLDSLGRLWIEIGIVEPEAKERR